MALFAVVNMGLEDDDSQVNINAMVLLLDIMENHYGNFGELTNDKNFAG